jgi:hypothetical protein
MAWMMALTLRRLKMALLSFKLFTLEPPFDFGQTGV